MLVLVFLRTRTSKIHLNNILHVPQATKSLLSVNRLARDNNAFLEFHPDHFSISSRPSPCGIID
jgi:hypothetical protein